MVFILLAALWFSGWVFAVIFLVITVLGLWEFYGLVENEERQPQKIFGTLAGVLVYCGTALTFLVSWPDNASWQTILPLTPFLLPAPLFFIAFIIEIYRARPNPLVNIAITILGIIYIALPLSLLTWFIRPDAVRFLGMPAALVGYFAFTWIYDTAAYLYGKQFGRHKFFERISPKKTWEGTIAGAAVTLAVAFCLGIFAPVMPSAAWFTMACLVILFGTHGDLAESLIKRSLNVKDSGTILPGHGGILDRFDTMLISAPFVFLYLFFTNHT